MPVPTELRLRRAEKLLEVDFDDGARFVLPAERSTERMLRSPKS